MKHRRSYKKNAEKKKSIVKNEMKPHILETHVSDSENYVSSVNVTRDHQKPSKRKASISEYETSEEKNPKMPKNNLTPETLPPPKLLTPSSPSSAVDSDDFAFLRRLPRPSNGVEKKDYFAALPDEVLLMMFKYFSKPTLVSCACVCKRWKRIAYDQGLWPRIELSQRKLQPGNMAHVLMRGPQLLRMSQTEISTPIFGGLIECMDNFTSKLEFLDLSMATVSLQDLELLLRTCNLLQKLSLENCDVNENICTEIAKNSNLIVLNMSQCTGLNESGVKSILSNCKKIVELNVAWTSLNASSIKCVCQFVHKEIQRINLSGCVKEITDSHVNALVIRCNKLKELDLSDATGITECSIDAIYNNLNDLEVLSLNRCYNIHPPTYTKLFLMPSIKHINIFGLFQEYQIDSLRKSTNVKINMMKFSYIARPTVGIRRTSIWSIRIQD